jgi:N-acetylmuramoyl-L-alanine amidase
MALTDRELLAKTLQAEAGNQGIGGMLAVGSVIRNRMKQGGSLSDVILAPAQFSAWNKVTGAVGGEQGQDMAALRPSEDAYAAADAILSGNAPDLTGGATHYYNPSISNPAWGKEKAGGDWTKIGAHIFGKAGDFRTGAAKMNGEQTQKPQGLLGGLLGGQGIGSALGLSPEFSDKLAMAVMAGTGDARLQPLIAQRAAGMKERRAEAKEQRQRNKSIEFLQSRADAGDATAKEILGAVSTGALPIGTGVSTYLTQRLTAPKDERTALMKEYDFSKTDPEFAKLLGLKNAPEAPAGLKALDTEFAKSLGEGGGAQNVAAAMQDLASVQTVLNKLEAGEELTGPFIGSLPESVRAFIAPEGLQAQQLVESVVQKNLRAILGGQFAQKEGEQLVRRAYNPSLTPAQNAARLRALIPTLQAAAENKLAMTEYFLDPKNNYSLKGFSGLVGVPSLSVFMNALDEGESNLSSSDKAPKPAPAAKPVVINGYTIEEIE